MMVNNPTPEHILIVGAGVFGLSTALSLIHNPTYNGARITIIDGSPTLPNPSGSSVDANRIVRTDYAHKQYAQLALQAQELWRDGRKEAWGGEGRYHEPGFVLTAVADKDAYLAEALSNVRSLAREDKHGRMDLSKIQELHGRDEIRKATGYEGVSGDHGYANFNSGWADAEACVAYALRRITAEGGDRVHIRPNTRVQSLLVLGTECKGVNLVGGEQIEADLTVLAAGAWTPTLIDLQGRCLATGQTMAFLDITQEEQDAMAARPTIINQSSGMFIIPPRNKLLKIARHGYGYRNPVKIPKKTLRPGNVDGNATSGDVEVSVPDVGVPIPLEAEEALRGALRELVPHMAERPFVRTRICWYCDT
jgi:sarcosine oxidase/L-pipecolate oxidase